MKISIQGQDYTTALDASRPLVIQRKLNEPTVCQLWLSLPTGGGLATPTRNQALAVTGDDGTTYFTGYLALSPAPVYAGFGVEGPRCRFVLDAISDELLLDRAAGTESKGATGATAGNLLATLVKRTGVTSLSTEALALSSPVSQFVSATGAVWSKCAGQVANEARAAYRAVNGALQLSSIPSAVLSLNEEDGSLDLAGLNLTTGKKRGMVNDVTVCGEHEPAAYVTEYFLGDGVTTEFNLAALPFCPLSSKRTLIREMFNEAAIDSRVWGLLGSNRYLALGAGGLSMQGGDGIDGATTLTWLDPVEMGGTLLLEATGVTLAGGSTGVVAGLFAGPATQAACTAGFLVSAQQSTGSVSVQPLVEGIATGTVYAINAANQYALRIRAHCNEPQRLFAIYRSSGDDGVLSSGGETNVAGASLHFEIQEFVNGVAGMPVTLFDGTVSNLPPVCSVVAASSLNLQGAMRAILLTNLGSGWVTSRPANGTPFTRRLGSTAQAAECSVESAGKLVFYAGYAPPVGEQITVSYRAAGRSVGRQVNTASQQALAQAGLPAICAWTGTVTGPAARSSQDCRNAALALVQAGSSENALWSGSYRTTNARLESDLWPGDALDCNAPAMGFQVRAIVRKVKLSYASSYPDLVDYAIDFANDWVEDLAIRTSTAVPADTWLPAIPNAVVLANLNALTVAAMSGNTVTVQTGTAAPTGGGFEIRRRDSAFMPGEDTDLVMRGSQSTLTFTRASASDRFYLRIFDGATPPNYSEFSAALIFNLPLSIGQ